MIDKKTFEKVTEKDKHDPSLDAFEDATPCVDNSVINTFELYRPMIEGRVVCVKGRKIL